MSLADLLGTGTLIHRRTAGQSESVCWQGVGVDGFPPPPPLFLLFKPIRTAHVARYQGPFVLSGSCARVVVHPW